MRYILSINNILLLVASTIVMMNSPSMAALNKRCGDHSRKVDYGPMLTLSRAQGTGNWDSEYHSLNINKGTFVRNIRSNGYHSTQGRFSSSNKEGVVSFDNRNSRMKYDYVEKLTNANMNKLLKSGVWIVRYFRNDCPQNKRFEMAWNKVVQEFSKQGTIHFATADCNVELYACQVVPAVPAYISYKDGKVLMKHQVNKYDYEDLKPFFENVFKGINGKLPEVGFKKSSTTNGGFSRSNSNILKPNKYPLNSSKVDPSTPAGLNSLGGPSLSTTSRNINSKPPGILKKQFNRKDTPKTKKRVHFNEEIDSFPKSKN